MNRSLSGVVMAILKGKTGINAMPKHRAMNANDLKSERVRPHASRPAIGTPSSKSKRYMKIVRASSPCGTKIE